MKFTIQHAVMNSTLYDGPALIGHPKDCIKCGLVLPFTLEIEDPKIYILKYYGNVRDVKDSIAWNFEISVHFTIDFTVEVSHGEVQNVIDEFMKATYQRAAISFEDYVKDREYIAGYILCPVEVLRLDKSFFM